ncbi:Integral membrane protein TerC [Paramagnetospirillum magnetotacticum MS-1]|uniref:Integral membrane protein TerC n=1 Tax=Paramagnetospirillum magnetotacticum MS-1 TaxID=272627 RepID=A0A0C2YTI2_PARME|nr:TerC family protein [Paramagnetospirillum magnetotacticum]KIL98005.1 Integral membrane protein TerC [Paramagnetospirillum magnetotacticum MS-1]
MIMAWISDPEIWISLTTLALLEIVLGIDNLVYLAIISNRLPEHQRPLGRRLGLAFAVLTRLGLLASLSWIVGLVDPVFMVWDHPVSWRDIILIGGGTFLVAKATHEIHGSLEGEEQHAPSDGAATASAGLAAVIAQIAVLDIVFSLDSVITAVGMARDLWVMVAAVILASVVMVASANPLSALIARHPTIKMLALSFLLLIGATLVADGTGFHMPKGYIYFAMAFSLGIEILNLIARRGKRTPVRLRNPVP